MLDAPLLRPGFDDVVRQSQDCFRVAMNALSRPGLPQSWRSTLAPPAPLTPNAASIVLALADFETTLWVDPAIRSSSESLRFLSFHTGAKLIDDASMANFALIAEPATMPPLTEFAQGTQDYPDRSTTLILQVASFNAEHRFAGPGVRDSILFGATPLPPDFAAQFVANRLAFPRGVDLLLASGDAIAGLPRSARLLEI